MQMTFKTLSLLALLTLGTAAFAQETTTDAPAEGSTEAPAETPAETPAEAPVEAPAETPAEPITKDNAQPGQVYVNAENGDWFERCIKVETGGTDICQMYQLLLDANDNAVAEIAMIPLAGGGDAVAGASIVAPLETLLSQPMTIRIDSGEPKRYGYTVCSARPLSPLLSSGCLARIGLTTAELAQFKAGNEAKLTLIPAAHPEAKVEVTISLTGFTAAFNSLSGN